MKTKIRFLFAGLAVVLTAALLAACSNPLHKNPATADRGKGTITVNLGTGARALIRQDELAKMSYNVTVTRYHDPGAGYESITQEAGPADGTVSFKVWPGMWIVTVDAFLEGVLRASGETIGPVEVIAGGRTTATVIMGLVTRVGTWSELLQAIKAANTSGINEAIIISENLTAGEPALIDGNRNITLWAENAVEITRTGTEASLFIVKSGSLTLGRGSMRGTIIIDGDKEKYPENNFSLITVSGDTASGDDSRLTMYDNVILRNNKAGQGGAVTVEYNGTFTMHGGTISGNTAIEVGGGVYVRDGNFTKTGGTIYGYGDGLEADWNSVKNDAAGDIKGMGHAVWADGDGGNGWRDKTAGPEDTMSVVNGVFSASGWEGDRDEGTEGLAYDLIDTGNNANTYRVSKGTVTGGVVVIPASYEGLPVTEIGDDGSDGAFAGTSITAITIPESVTVIGSYAFYGCTGITSIIIPASVTSIGQNAFDGWTKSQTIYIYNAGEVWDNNLQNGCEADVCFMKHNGLVYELINNNTGLRVRKDTEANGEVSIPATYNNWPVTEIGSKSDDSKSGAFSNTAITSITIPDTVTVIGNYAFSGCNKLTTVTCNAETPPELGRNVFDDNTALSNIYVPVDSVAAYKAAPNWSSLPAKIIISSIP